jgi:hypothetical protein
MEVVVSIVNNAPATVKIERSAHRSAAAHAEAEERKQRDEELAAKAVALAAEAEREKKVSGSDTRDWKRNRAGDIAESSCEYRAGNEERRCMVRVGRNGNFVRGMKLRLQEPKDPSARSEPWPYTGPLPRRRGCW